MLAEPDRPNSVEPLSMRAIFLASKAAALREKVVRTVKHGFQVPLTPDL